MRRTKAKQMNHYYTHCIYCLIGLIILSQTSILSSINKYLRKLNVIEYNNAIQHTSNRKEDSYSICPDPKYYTIIKRPSDLPEHCKGILLNHSFSQGRDLYDASTSFQDSFLGTSELLKNAPGHTSQFMMVSNRKYQWQGPFLVINDKLRECITDDTYYFQVDIRLTTSDGTVPKCFSDGIQCPDLTFCFRNRGIRNEYLRCRQIAQFREKRSIRKGNNWFTWFDNTIVFPYQTLLQNHHSEAYVAIGGPEVKVDIAVDNFKVYSKWANALKVQSRPQGVCDELLINGNAALSNISHYPWRPAPFDDEIRVLTDTNGNYFSMNDRSKVWSAPYITLTPGCLRSDAKYKFTGYIWIHSNAPISSRAVLRYTLLGEYTFDTIGLCPLSSKSIGWVKCTGILKVSKSRYKVPPFTFTFITFHSRARTYWRDLSLTPITCGIDANPGDICPRVVKVLIDAQSDPSIRLHATKGTTIVTDSPRYIMNSKTAGTFWARLSFDLELPDAGDWVARFSVKDDSGAEKEVWPLFAEVRYRDPAHCEGVKKSLTIYRPPDANCNNLIRADFDACPLTDTGYISVCYWYATSGKLKLTRTSYYGRHALSTDGRKIVNEGMLAYFDDRCMIFEKQYTLHAKFLLLDKYGNIKKCNPSKWLMSNDSCPRASIRTRKNGKFTSYAVIFAKALAPILDDGWSTLYGSFTIDSNMVEAESVSVVIDGARADLEILIDDISITPTEEINAMTNPGGCVKNADFEIGDSRNWECVGENNNCGLQMTQPGRGGSSFSLATINRLAGFWGIDQQLEPGCFIANTMYEINAWLKIADYNGTIVSCDPFNFYQGLKSFCPVILIKDPANDRYKMEVRSASTVGPFDSTGWNHVYGLVTMTETMLTWPSLVFYIGWGRANINLIIDDISIKPADRNTYGIPTCTQLIRNGNAEVGDARFWFIRGKGAVANNGFAEDAGSIQIVPGDKENGSSYAFHHKGPRSLMRHGMWQDLDMSCMPINTKWKISAKIRLLDMNDNGKHCIKLIVGGPTAYGEHGCPIFRLEAYYENYTNYHYRNLLNQNTDIWNATGWNKYEHLFVMDESLSSRQLIYLFIHGVMPMDTYMVDDISVTPVDDISVTPMY